LLSSEPRQCPRLREAATTLSASGGQRVRTTTENKVESEVQFDNNETGN